jgi:uncharacterized protein (TIGR03067 family)
MRTFALVFTATFLGLTVHGAPAPLPKPDPSKDDWKKIQGAWDYVGCRMAGRDVAVTPGELWMVITKDRITVNIAGSGVMNDWTYTLDASKKPKTLDMKSRIGGFPNGLSGVYVLEGDSFKCCHNNGVGDSPADLSAAGASQRLDVWKRRKR